MTSIASAVVVTSPATGDLESERTSPVSREVGAEPGRFAPADRQRLASDPSDRVRVLLAGEVGAGSEIAALVRAHSGAVSTSEDKAGFVVADMPSAEALDLQGAPVLTAMAIDRKVRVPSTAVGLTDVQQADAVSADENLFRPYVATPEIGATQFIKKHPRYDGRGVTIAVIDSVIDWTAPGMQTTSIGEPKLTRIVDFRHRPPLVTDRVVSVSDGRFEVDGATYTLPAGLEADEVRFGTYTERGDVNLDGDAGTDRFGVAVVDSDEFGRTVFVDTDQDLSLSDEKALGDWNSTRRSASFGVDDPATTDIVEVRPFALLECQSEGSSGPCAEPTGARPGDVWDVLLSHDHAVMVSATAAGHDFGPGDEHFDGVAPGAQVWSLPYDGSDPSTQVSELSNSILYAAKQGADVMNLSTFVFSVLGPPADPVATLIDNVAQAYGTIAAVANGNSGPGLQTITGSPITARSAIGVGATLSSASMTRLFARPGMSGTWLMYYSAHGPTPDGHWTPDVVAPTASLTPDTPWDPHTSDLQQPSGHPSPLPPGYQIGVGTSNATPFVTGALALLISAAKAEDIPYTAHTLKRAVELGAVPLDRPYGPEEIGHGLVNVPRAFTWLKRLAAEGNIDRDVDTVTFNNMLGQGQGIYQLGEQRDVEQVTLVTNDATTRDYELTGDQAWIHLDRKHVRLPGAEGDAAGTAQFEVRIDPSVRDQPGVHTGVVTVDDPTSLDPADHEMLVTVVTPHPVDATNQLHGAGSGKTGIPAEGFKKFFVRVPAGAQSLEVRSVRPADDPAGVEVFVYPPADLQKRTQRIPWLFDPGPGQTATDTIADPPPGIWEITVWAHELPRNAGSFWPAHDPDGAVVQRHAYDLTITVTPSAQ